MGMNVKVIGLAGGLAMGHFGNTHYGIEDLALMRAVPGLTVIVPADGAEIVRTIEALITHQGPVFVRLTGAVNNPVVYSKEYDFAIGKAVALRPGTDVAIFACGTMVHGAGGSSPARGPGCVGFDDKHAHIEAARH